MTRILVIDVEAHDKDDPKIIEYGEMPITLDPFTMGDVTSSRHNPGCPIEPGAMAVHGIIDADVADCPAWESAVVDFPDYLVGHNVDFDANAMSAPDSVKRICTLALARKIWPEAKSHTLMGLVFMLDQNVGQEFFQSAHTVETDIKACAWLLGRMLPILGPRDIEHLWEISEEARVPTHMPFGKFKGRPMKEVDSGFRRWYAGVTNPPPDPYILRAFEKYPPVW